MNFLNKTCDQKTHGRGLASLILGAVLLLNFPVTSLMAQNPSLTSTKSYVITRDTRQGEQKVLNDLKTATPAQVHTDIKYYDRFGRELQRISYHKNTSNQDVVFFNVYDNKGRPSTAYLPYAPGAASGAYISNPTSGQSSYYTSGANVAHDVNPYSQTTFEDTPLSRVLEQGGIGADWQIGSGNTTKTEYTFNELNDVFRWEITENGGLKLSNGTAAFSEPYYRWNELDLVTVKGPNWESGHGDNGVVFVFTDYRGREVLRRTFENNEALDTYFVYDDFGNVRYTITPEAVKAIKTANLTGIDDDNVFTSSVDFPGSKPTNQAYYYMPGVTVTLNPTRDYTVGFSLEVYPIDDSMLTDWIYINEYDDRNRLVSKKMPGAEPVYFVYDKRGRMILSQDGNQRAGNEWTFTKYDFNDRPVLTGIITESGDRAAVQSMVEGQFTVGSDFEVRGSAVHGYTNQVYPNVSNENEYLAVTYYDDYDFKTSWGSDFNFDGSNGINNGPSDDNVLGRSTGSKVRVLGQNTWLKSVSFYDEYGRNIQSISDHHLGGINKSFTEYNWEGRLVKNRTEHEVVLTGVNKTLSVEHRVEYYPNGDRKSIWHSIDDEPEVLLVSYNYNEVGQRIEQKLHSTDGGTTFMQSIDFTQNIQGWLTGINNAARDDGEQDLFGMELYYNSSPSGSGITYSPQHDGNLAGVTWSNASMDNTAEQRSFAYTYDKIQRLKAADYEELKNGNWNVRENHYDVSNLQYDLNGNIQSLNRNHSISSSATAVDQLQYTYDGNQLQSVNDVINHDKGFKDGAESSLEYTYDANGNMISDANKSISSITYNHLNRPEAITFVTGDKIEYTYDAIGTRLSQRVTVSGSVQSEIDYMPGLIYEDGELAEILTSQGRVRVEKVATDYNYDYQYFITDHLGNNRVLAAPLSRKYVANMEEDREEQEKAQFLNIVETQSTQANHTSGGSQASALNAASGEMVGMAKAFKVYAGDVIDLSVYGRYNGSTGVNEVAVQNLIFTALSGVYNLSGGGEGASFYNAIYSQFGTSSLVDQSPGDAPAAALNYLFFDTNYNLVMGSGTGYEGIDTGALNSWQYLSHSFTASQEGYVFVYTSNESTLDVNVYFDDLVVEHTSSASDLQADDFYPFGLPMDNNGFLRAGVESNRFQFQNKEWQTALGLNLYDFHARQFDPAIGRWHAIDPAGQFSSPYVGMGNIPNMAIDPDGELAWFVPIIAGAAINLGGQALAGNVNSFWDALGYAAVGAGSAALGMGVTSGITTALGTGASFGTGFAAAFSNTGLAAAAGFYAGAAGGAIGAMAGGFVGSAGNAWLGGASFKQGLKAGLKGGLSGIGAGALFGGISSGLASKKIGANFWTGRFDDTKSLLAYTYVVDVRTGRIRRISLDGGNDVHIYYYGHWVDDASFVSNGSFSVIEGVNTVNSFRFWESATSTIAAFNIPATDQSGFFLEPRGASTVLRGQDQRIPAGTYNLEWYERPSGSITARIYNDQVPQNRYILEHVGNFPADTEGCLLPGFGWTANAVQRSGDAHNMLHAYFVRTGIENVNLNIFNAFD